MNSPQLRMWCTKNEKRNNHVTKPFASNLMKITYYMTRYDWRHQQQDNFKKTQCEGTSAKRRTESSHHSNVSLSRSKILYAPYSTKAEAATLFSRSVTAPLPPTSTRLLASLPMIGHPWEAGCLGFRLLACQERQHQFAVESWVAEGMDILVTSFKIVLWL